MAMDVEIRAPAEQTEGTRSQILRWLKSVGESVAENEPLIEIETDKVTVEVASPGSGILREILKQEQEEISPGELLGRLNTSITAASGVTPARTVASAPTASAATGLAENPGLTAGSPNTQPVASAGASAANEAGNAAAISAGRNSLSPAVRRLLADHELDASAVQGTGRDGRITV